MMQQKYNAIKTVVDGIKFDSKIESRFYTYFQEKWIKILELQPTFLLQDSFKLDGKTIRKIEYIADFLIEYQWDRIYIDVKGMKTPVFALKLKMWQKRYGQENILLIVKSFKDLERQLT